MKAASRLALVVISGAALALAPVLGASASSGKVHQLGGCTASGTYPICSFDSATAHDVASMHVHVSGSVGAGYKVQVYVAQDCWKGGSGFVDSRTYKDFPAFSRALPILRGGNCAVSVTVNPVSTSAPGGTIRAWATSRRLDGR
jgi:hypothetical protein